MHLPSKQVQQGIPMEAQKVFKSQRKASFQQGPVRWVLCSRSYPYSSLPLLPLKTPSPGRSRCHSYWPRRERNTDNEREQTCLTHPQLPPLHSTRFLHGSKNKIRFEDFILSWGPGHFQLSQYLELQVIFII